MLFDVDGVLADTADHHAAAWREAARSFGIDASALSADSFRGLSRRASLDAVLAGRAILSDDADAMMAMKNALYIAAISNPGGLDAMPGAREMIAALRRMGLQVAAVSASRNAMRILKAIGLHSQFSVIVDGTDPTVQGAAANRYAVARDRLGVPAGRCAAVDDSAIGISLAKAAGLYTVGLGSPKMLRHADVVCRSLNAVRAAELVDRLRTVMIPAA